MATTAHDVRKIAGQQIADPSPGAVLRSAIGAQGLSVSEAAARLGTSQSTFSLMLHDRRAISRDMALRIEEAFGVPGYVLARLRFEADFRASEAERANRAA